MKKAGWLVAGAALLMLSGPAYAVPIYFTPVEDNSGQATVLAGQLWVDVVEGTQVDFIFHNNGPIPSSICDIYFDNGTLLAMGAALGSTGVSFSAPATPGDLSGGNNLTPKFETSDGFSADSDSPNVFANGVNPGETLTISFTLLSGKTYADTLVALANGNLRIGLHVQGIGTTGQSDSFVNGPPPDQPTEPVPEPGTILLLGSGLVGVGLLRRRKMIRK